MKPSVLFVCMGNICRSPTGESLLRHLAHERGVDEQVAIESAGTIGSHEGSPPDERMTRAARRHGYTLRGSARQVRADDLDRFDLVIAMDRENLHDLRSLWEGPGEPDHVRLLSDFLDISEWQEDVPDPYYGGEAGFDYVIEMVETACPEILDHLLDLRSEASTQDA